MQLTTTLNRIRACSPCTSGWRKLLKYVGDDFDPDSDINLLTILESNGIADTLWTLRATEQDSTQVAKHLAVEFAEHALPIFEKYQPNDTRPRKALEAAKDFLTGTISINYLRRADAAAAADAADADAAAYAAGAYAAGDAAADAARETMRAKQAEIIKTLLEY